MQQYILFVVILICSQNYVAFLSCYILLLNAALYAEPFSILAVRFHMLKTMYIQFGFALFNIDLIVKYFFGSAAEFTWLSFSLGENLTRDTYQPAKTFTFWAR